MTRHAIVPTDMLAINAVLVSARQAIDIICDRWSLILVVALLQGEARFNGLLARTGMASRLLTSRLLALEASGIILRIPYSMHPLRHEYRLTNMGQDLFDVVLEMARWEARWAGPDAMAHRLVHQSCGAPLVLQVCCQACGLPADARQIETRVSRAQIRKAPDKQNRHRRSSISGADAATTAQLLGATLDIFGDKWGIEILICAFFRVHRFGDFRDSIGIAANILADRLARLVDLGLLAPGQLSTEGSPTKQAGYWLTPKGIDVYAIMVAVHRWADTWVRARYLSPVRLVHRACGEAFLPMLACINCAQPATRADVPLIVE